MNSWILSSIAFLVLMSYNHERHIFVVAQRGGRSKSNDPTKILKSKSQFRKQSQQDKRMRERQQLKKEAHRKRVRKALQDQRDENRKKDKAKRRTNGQSIPQNKYKGEDFLEEMVDQSLALEEELFRELENAPSTPLEFPGFLKAIVFFIVFTTLFTTCVCCYTESVEKHRRKKAGLIFEEKPTWRSGSSVRVGRPNDTLRRRSNLSAA